MPVSLRPRHPRDIAAAQRERLHKRPSITFRRGSSPLLTILPAIITALAVYAGLVYVDKIARRITRSAAGEEEKEQVVRHVDGVVKPPSILEQEPPPSPDWVVQQFTRRRAEAAAARDAVRVPVLVPELEPEPIPLRRIELPPLEAPDLPVAETDPRHEPR